MTATSDLDDLYRALGQLVVATAEMEMRLRDVVGQLAGDDDAGWIIFEGQSVEWLISNGKAVLGEHSDMRRWPTENTARITEALNTTQEVARLRNFLVHGFWRRGCLGGCECLPRPARSEADHRVFHVHRSRHRKGYDSRLVAVADVITLATKARTVTTELRAAYDAAVAAWLGRNDAAIAEAD
ncbi:hypothetical protein [Streptomyces lydicus]|uniref:hypothetical protein n=1 Tax=Streptomyces lydicus TaxID=47763 RepID=UPI00378E51D0